MAEQPTQASVHVPVIPRNQFLLETVPIGRGGYGTVYRGQHTKLGLVAVKTLIDTGLLPQKHLRTLQTEAEKLRQVCQHPSILNLHGIITEKDNYSLVLEYMPLGSATEFRKDFTVQWPLIIQIIRDVVDGMTFLHGHDPTILHLDLKADNILLDKGVRAKISDFGLSEWKTITMTVTRGGGGQSSSRKCTVTHVPPEVWSNVNLPADRYYDIYGFGIIIWELLSGETPYKTSSEELIRSAVLTGQRPDFRQIPEDCPMFLTKIMTRCWHQKPTQRPAFKDLKPEIDEQFTKNYRKDIVKSLKKVRQEITRMYPTTDAIYVFTNEIDSMVEPLEPVEEPDPSTSSGTSTGTTTPKVIDDMPPPKQPEPPKEEKEIPKVLFRPKDDLTTEEKDVRKILSSPTACRLAKTRYFRDIFKISEDTRQMLLDPVKRKKYIEADETLSRQVRYAKHNAFHELDGEFFEYRRSLGQQQTESSEKDFYNRQRNSWSKEKNYGSYNSEDTERGKKHKRASDSLEKNPAMKKLKNGGDYYKVKKIMENPEMLKQALDDKRKGVDSSLRLIAIDSETIELVKNPFLLMMVFGSEYEIARKFKEHHKGLYMELFGNATFKDDLPGGGYKLPADLKDLIPYWLEAEMEKEGFDVNKLIQQQEMERRRRRHHYGMFPDSDDDDFEDYGPMRYMSRRMMDFNMRPGSNLTDRIEGYQLRRMVENVERNSTNKTDLAKKIMRIMARPPKEEREESKMKDRERRERMAQMAKKGVHPMEMMMMMGGDPSRMDEKMMRQMMKMEQRKMKDMKSSKKASPTPTPSTATATKSQPDLETDAAGSMPKDQGQTDPSDPKKSKPETTTADKSSTGDSKVKQNKDGSVEIEHKSSGAFGALTKLFFGKSAKVPSMQVGDKNVMHIGRHLDDSDSDDGMLDSVYDKFYEPPSVARAPTKQELDKISARIHGDYRNLGRQLKMPYNTVEQVIEDYRKEGMSEMTYQIIRKWMQLNGDEANNVALSNALHKMRRDDLSKYLRF